MELQTTFANFFLLTSLVNSLRKQKKYIQGGQSYVYRVFNSRGATIVLC